jgi:hypothetical protein
MIWAPITALTILFAMCTAIVVEIARNNRPKK